MSPKSVPTPLEIATSWPVVRRSLGYAVTVGTLLVAINHGDAILGGDLDSLRLLKMSLTALVPYAVSTLSSVQATRANRGGSESP